MLDLCIAFNLYSSGNFEDMLISTKRIQPSNDTVKSLSMAHPPNCLYNAGAYCILPDKKIHNLHYAQPTSVTLALRNPENQLLQTMSCSMKPQPQVMAFRCDKGAILLEYFVQASRRVRSRQQASQRGENMFVERKPWNTASAPLLNDPIHVCTPPSLVWLSVFEIVFDVPILYMPRLPGLRRRLRRQFLCRLLHQM
jgi:hypothetical protein